MSLFDPKQILLEPLLYFVIITLFLILRSTLGSLDLMKISSICTISVLTSSGMDGIGFFGSAAKR